MPSVFVSACLTGRACRYNGGDEERPDLLAALRRDGVEIVSFCPEEEAGLGTPRPAAHVVGGDGDAVADGDARVALVEDGADRTDAFLAGARAAVAAAEKAGCRVAYLKEKSPSCGCAIVHTPDGLRPGCGVTTALLKRAGIACVSVD